MTAAPALAAHVRVRPGPAAGAATPGPHAQGSPANPWRHPA